MHTAFSERLANLRKERGLTQKEAAEQLDISAALLSHYEKGIRECGLSFVCKAAAFYDVSCDYLLGVSDARRGMDESFDAHDTPQDREFRTVTLFRAAAMLSDELSAVGVQDRLRSYFALAIYRVAAEAAKQGILPKSWMAFPDRAAEALSDAVMDSIIKNGIPALEKPAPARTAPPACVQTVIENCERILQKEFAEFFANETAT
ncbi:MAG: helix-turn-helix domain-containing protein [Candidatus Fimenecus sp.]